MALSNNDFNIGDIGYYRAAKTNAAQLNLKGDQKYDMTEYDPIDYNTPPADETSQPPKLPTWIRETTDEGSIDTYYDVDGAKTREVTRVGTQERGYTYEGAAGEEKVVQSWEIEYADDGSGKMERQTLYDGEGHKYKKITYDESGAKCLETDYAGAKETGYTYKGAPGEEKVVQSWEIEYTDDSMERMKKQTLYDADGKPYKDIDYAESGAKKLETEYSGTTERGYTYEGARGEEKVVQSWEIEYADDSMERMKKQTSYDANGKQYRTTYYNSDGIVSYGDISAVPKYGQATKNNNDLQK
jgi:hypothetical protein